LEPDIIILETGANDGLRGVDPAVTEENLTRIITRIKGEDRTVVLAGMEIVVNMGSEYTTAFSGIYPRVAEQQGVILIPFFLKNVAAEPQLNQPDGVHPTAEGYKVVTETVYPYVVEAIKVWRVAHLQ
jgi:acyl-CoA thioesterase-1